MKIMTKKNEFCIFC